ncbi:hypothetical protein MMC09_003031 [Bachmanniomyces sp. S44760]|nr:hypothetical protein [Bachmanniomyces sp. S44760]
MANKEDSSALSQPSLLELCTLQGIENISKSKTADVDFASLEPRLQQLLFGKLRTENERLRGIEKQWKILTRSCPHIDLQMHLSRDRIEHDSGDDEENGYNQVENFSFQWSYHPNQHDIANADGDEEQTGARPTDAGADIAQGEGSEREGNSRPKPLSNTRWHHHDLFSKSLDSDLVLCTHGFGSAECSCRMERYSQLLEHVSSQLLLYRICVVFGMPPPLENDGYKTCWDVDLFYHDGVSKLSFYDYKGAASARFSGTAEASVNSLKLLNFLIGMNCPHTYDGIVAGTAA